MQDLFLQIALQYGLIGVFAAAVLLNASVLLPLPFDILFIAVASLHIYNPVLLGIVAGIGAAIGEMVAYCLGFFGSKAIEKMTLLQVERITDFKKKIKGIGTIFIFIGALVPFPFDLIGIAAGLIKFDWKRFFIAVLLGRTIRHVLIAVAIYYGIEALSGFFILGA